MTNSFIGDLQLFSIMPIIDLCTAFLTHLKYFCYACQRPVSRYICRVHQNVYWLPGGRYGDLPHMHTGVIICLGDLDGCVSCIPWFVGSLYVHLCVQVDIELDIIVFAPNVVVHSIPHAVLKGSDCEPLVMLQVSHQVIWVVQVFRPFFFEFFKWLLRVFI